MNKGIFSRVEAYVEQHGMLASRDHVVVGVSGGADSVCLLLMLCELSRRLELKLTAVHVNHGIRKEAAEDGEYVKELCEEKGVPFILVEEDVRGWAARSHLSEEEAGRYVRYRAFREVLKGQGSTGAGKVAVAHNANDRAETMLFHLFRGTGLTGLGSIRPVRGNIIRPLLCLKREEIEEYLEEAGRGFCRDRTNEEDTYTRNRIRRHILPFAEKKVCRGAVSHMCETADMLAEADQYIQGQAEKAYRSCCIREEKDEIVLAAGRLQEEDAFLHGRILLLCLEKLSEGRKDITSSHISAIEGLLSKTGSSEISLPYGLKAVKEYDHLILCRANRERKADAAWPGAVVPPIPGRAEIPGLGTVEFSLLTRAELDIGEMGIEEWCIKSQFLSEKSCTKWFDYDKITRSLAFRTREPGDYLTINSNYARKSLKSYMIDRKIPKSERGGIYVLAEGMHILWVPGYRISEYYKITENTKHILQVQIGGDFKCQRE
ncbi:MAG: tRNA lysidine(34) synthetase TilS [Lachnospiraceae bacterium]|nr:tRNA lysidine(34) synthetase TilS [Lachnospiraceae bacterium]